MTHSTYLFARPSFLRGVARLADVGGVLNRYDLSKTPDEADAKALGHDWMAVAEDMQAGFEQMVDEVESSDEDGTR